MPRFAANLSMLFQDRAFLDRFAAAATCGFKGVEFLFPYEWPARDIRACLDEHGLEQVLFNLPPGDWAAGERGLAALPGRERDFADSVDLALDYAETLGCRRLHVMAGCPGPDVDPREAMETYVANLRLAADRLAARGIAMLIEPINQRDVPGYFLRDSAMARTVLDAVARPGAKLQFDLYHAQISEGDLSVRLRTLMPSIGHLQVANPPDRREPSQGEVNFPYLFALIDALGYEGWIGCEYRPAGTTEAGLGWAAPYGIHAPDPTGM
jgi:hydroxypyruvate isomerase